MPVVGYNNVPLHERANYVYDGSIWRPMLANASGEILAAIAAGQSLQALGYGWVNGAWQKAPMPLGYSDTIQQRVGSASLAAGTNSFSTTAPPAGKVHVYTSLTFVYSGTVTNVYMSVVLHGHVSNSIIVQTSPVVSNNYYDRQGYWALKVGEYFAFNVFNATLNDDAFLDINGFVADIDQ